MFATPVGPSAPGGFGGGGFAGGGFGGGGFGGPPPDAFVSGAMTVGGGQAFGLPAHGAHGRMKRHGTDMRADGAHTEMSDVSITILAARKLVAGDTAILNWGKASSDPYCVVRPVKGLALTKGAHAQTAVVKQTLDPEWKDASFRFAFDHKLSRFKIVVIDWDDFKPGDMLGKLVIGLPAFYELHPDGEGWRTLQNWFPLGIGSKEKWNWLKGMGSLGELHVRIKVRFAVPLALPLSCVPLRFPQVQVALGWDFEKHGKTFDIDASLIGFGPKWNVVDVVSYKQLMGFGGLVRHSGDDTTGHGEGDDETITLDLMRMPRDVECFCLVVNSFSGQSLRQVKHAYIRVIVNGATATFLGLYDNKVDKDAWKRGERMTANPFAMRDCTGLFFGMLIRVDDQWAFVTVNEAANGRTIEESLPMMVHIAQTYMPEAQVRARQHVQQAAQAAQAAAAAAKAAPSSATAVAPGQPARSPGGVAAFVAGSDVEYFSESKQQWFPAKVVAFHPDLGLYDLNIKPQVKPQFLRWPAVAVAAPPSVPPAATQVPAGHSAGYPSDFSPGQVVEYLSSSMNVWMAAKILACHASKTYDIDVGGQVRQQVPRERLRAPPAVGPPGATVGSGPAVAPPGVTAPAAAPPGVTAPAAAPPGVTGVSTKPPDVPNPFAASFAGSSSNVPPPPAGIGSARPETKFGAGTGSGLPDRYVVAGFVSPESNPVLEMGGAVHTWGTEQVMKFLDDLQLSHVKDKFRENAVDGPMLLSLTEEDLCSELGVSKLQARKVVQRVPR